MRIDRGRTTGSATIATYHDADTDDETFTVWLDEDSQLPEVLVGEPDEVTVTIRDDGETPSPPASVANRCGSPLTARYGGLGGRSFDAATPRSLQLRAGNSVDALILNGSRHGGAGGDLGSSLQLGSGEYISRVEVRHGNYVDRLVFTTNEGRVLSGGGGGGTLARLDGVRVTSIGGRSGDYLDYIEITYCSP